MELDFPAAIVGMLLFVPGYGLVKLGELIGKRVKGRLRIVAVWPFIGLGWVFLWAAALYILWNLVGPIVMGIWKWVS